jgi:hypothetical protein
MVKVNLSVEVSPDGSMQKHIRHQFVTLSAILHYGSINYLRIPPKKIFFDVAVNGEGGR